MSTKLVFGVLALAAATGAMQPTRAWADGPAAAYSNAATDASLDDGEQRVAADDDNKARQRDLSDAYHNGYNARAKEDAETYASLREQLKRSARIAAAQTASQAGSPASSQVSSDQAAGPASQQIAAAGMPPLPPGMVGEADGVQVATVQTPRTMQRALPMQSQDLQARQYAPTAQAPASGYTEYAQAPQYPQGYRQPAYAQQYAETEPVQEQAPVYVQQQAYVPPQAYATSTPQVVEYVPVYGQPAYVPRPPAQRPVVTIAAAASYAPYGQAYYAPGYRPRVAERRALRQRYAYPVQQAAYPGWD
jgi:hypothetical protein